ncbi:MAG TPA: hypothetical protein VK483_15430 [Chitinophagaceae bacterium]|nr:hypothetical protein [Chitinophagaceae bacterium]
MRRTCSVFFILFFLLRSFFPAAQLNAVSHLNKTSATLILLKEEQERFLGHLDKTSFAPGMMDSLTGYIESETESIRLFIMSGISLTDPEKEKALKSLVYFLKYLGENIEQQKFKPSDIPDALGSYKSLLKALLYHTSVTDVLVPLGPQQTRLLANAFWQYNESGLLDDIAVYKLIASSSPQHIIQFLENKPRFRFADSLVNRAADHDPVKASSYLARHKDRFRDNTHTIYLQEIVSISENKFASELMPFLVPLAEKKITADQILEKRMDVTGYFQLLVNTIKNELAEHGDPAFLFHSSLRKGIKQKSLSFYVNSINELHSSADNIRFASVKGLRPEDLYYILTSCEDELYTSSYLGLYRRLMEQLKDHPVDSIFQIVQYDNFRVFMRMAANYNTLGDFLNRLPQTGAAKLLERFISGIETDTNTGLEKAMDIADSFTCLMNAAGINELIRDELRSNLERCREKHLFFGIRLYSILTQVYELVNEKDPGNKLWEQVGNYELLKRNAIQNKNAEIIELVMFYGDEDGVASFNNFLALFKDSKAWKVSKNNFWVTIRSVSDQPLIIYANLPLDTKQELDIQAQDSLNYYLEKESLKPGILIHRGHSYHLSNTLKRMQPSVKLALLGSCGGYNSIISVANINPDAQIIVTKKTGSKCINDPVIEEINRTLLEKKDLVWSAVWENLEKRFMKNEFALNLFNEYIPPGKNVSLFVLKLFNNYN